jgi:PAS domain S-box-containing protein
LLRILFSQQEKRKAEEQLALSEQRFRSLVQDGSDLIAILDEEGFYKYVAPNREITLGIAASEFEGKHIRAFLHPDDEDQIIDKLNVLKRGDHIKIGPIRIRGANNKWRWIEGTLTNMLHNPAVRGIVSNTSDITDRRNYELQLKKSIKEKETLLMEIHHRVKNNLAVVSGMMQLQAFESENRELRDKLFSSVSRIQTMGAIHEILYQSENFSQIDFTENIKKLTANISETFPKDIDISYAISPVELNINQAIPSSLVINEVITNAFKHAFTGHETGRLMVELEENQGEVKVTIKDNGNGLSNMPAKSNGESLGLKLIDTLAQQLDADYSYSESDYGGTVFNFSFFKADYNGIGSAHL